MCEVTNQYSNISLQDISFIKEILLVIIGAILGALFTAFINDRAIHRQAEFTMKKEIIVDFIDKIKAIQDELETLAIQLPNNDWEVEALIHDIYKIDTMSVSFANYVQLNRIYVSHYVSANLKKQYKDWLMKFHHYFFKRNIDLKTGYPSDTLRSEIEENDKAQIHFLIQQLNCMYEILMNSLECLISIGIIANVRRKIRNKTNSIK